MIAQRNKCERRISNRKKKNEKDAKAAKKELASVRERKRASTIENLPFESSFLLGFPFRNLPLGSLLEMQSDGQRRRASCIAELCERRKATVSTPEERHIRRKDAQTCFFSVQS